MRHLEIVGRSATRSLLAVALFWVVGLRAADQAKAPAAAKPEVKALLDRALADWDDPAQKQAVLRELDEVFPAQLAELQVVAERDRDEANEMTDRLLEQADHLVDLKKDKPREYERAVRACRLEDECLGLAQKARAAQGAAREPLVASLKLKLAEAFDVKQQALERELATKEADLGELRRRVTKRMEGRNQLIEQRTLDLLGDREAKW